MTIQLIVEDGSVVDDANTYASLEYVQKYAAYRGEELDEDEEVTKASIINAMDFIEGLSQSFQGSRVTANQNLQFPRSGVWIDRNLIPYNVIPRQLKDAVAQLVIDIKLTGPLQATTGAFAVKRRKLEGLEIEYAVGPNAQGAVRTSHEKAMALLNPLFMFRSGNNVIR